MGQDLVVGHGGMAAADLLAEPRRRTGFWTPAIVRRLIAAHNRPVAVGGIELPLRMRLEAAGWPIVAPGSDLEAARRAFWPHASRLHAEGGYGSLRPRLVLVGENVNRSDQRPFASRSGTWLFAGLRARGWDELQLYVTNALTLQRKRRGAELAALYEALLELEPIWVAIGRESASTLRAAKVPAIEVPSPQWHKRYKHDEAVEGYAKRMEEAGLPHGGWDELNGTVSVEELPALAPPYDIVSVAHRSEGRATRAMSGIGGGASGGSSKLATPAREKARRLYVIEGKKGKDIAEELGVHPNTISEVARAEGWQEERDRYHRQLTEEARLAASRAEAKAAANCRRLAWAASERGLASLAKRLADGSYQPDAFACQALTRIALELSERVNDPEEPAPEFEGRTLREMLTVLKDRIEDNLLGGPLP